jgi:hypothetical protein
MLRRCWPTPLTERHIALQPRVGGQIVRRLATVVSTVILVDHHHTRVNEKPPVVVSQALVEGHVLAVVPRRGMPAGADGGHAVECHATEG